MKKRLPLDGFTVVVKNGPREQYVKLRKGRGVLRGMAWLDRYVYDPGLKRWELIDSTLRTDLAKTEEFVMPLIGDESVSEIDEHIGLATDTKTDDWFANKVRPDWNRIQQRIYDREEQRANARTGKASFHIPGRD